MVCCLCSGCCIPKSTNDFVIIRPASKTFINGMAGSYFYDDEDRDLIFKSVSKKEMEDLMDDLNTAIINEYPCDGCLCFGYLFSPCTLGLSFCLPYRKVK